MEEKNPLEFHTSVPQPKRSLQLLQGNKRGRPSLEKAINFSPQPKSIISQLLNKAQKEKYDCNNEDIILNQGPSDVPYTESIFEKDLDSEIELSSQNTGSDFQEGSNFHRTCSDDSLESFKYNYVSHKHKQKNCQKQSLLHDKKHASEYKIPEIACYVCSYRSSGHKAHRAHMSTHRNQPYICNFPDCNYSCKLSSNLIKHKRIHTSEKPYLCDQCTFRSNFGNSLKVHKRTHTSERPYGCLYCSYSCNSSSNLKKHCLHRHQVLS